MVMQKIRRMLVSIMPSDSPEKTKRDDEAGAREKNRDAEDKDTLKPSQEKIPEGPDNLRRREDWFQKRTGGTD